MWNITPEFILILPQTVLMWSFQFNLEFIIRPRNLTLAICSMVVLSSTNNQLLGNVIYLKQTFIKLVFDLQIKQERAAWKLTYGEMQHDSIL